MAFRWRENCLSVKTEKTPVTIVTGLTVLASVWPATEKAGN